MVLGWQWMSRKGSARHENRDTCGLFSSEEYTFAVVVDASSKGERGIEFNEIWVSNLLRVLPFQLPTHSCVIGAMRTAQTSLREARLFVERACYAALLLPHGPKNPTAFICGDCSIGFNSNESETQWLTPTQTLAGFCERFSPGHAKVSPNIVTNTLNGRRFDTPLIIDLPPSTRRTWVLATDGFLAAQKQGLTGSPDDSSCLLLGEDVKVQCDTDRKTYS